ncbi:MAG: dTDP-4-dehydrorhamnose reductase, partial [Thermoanaerobaculia bacterium]
VVKETLPEVIINTAGFTAVDRAEGDQEAAFAVNASGARNIANAAALAKARLIQLSTDYVFDGCAGRPYRPEDEPRPISVYGSSKKAGEDAVIEVLGDGALVVRTAWLYSRHGKNFVKKILNLLGEKEELAIVADEVGTPTWAHGLAEAIWRMASLDSLNGIQHWTDAGVASWYDFAVAIRDEAAEQGLVETGASIRPVRAADKPRPARRPAFGVLDKTATWEALEMEPPHWREALREMLTEMKGHG